MFATIEDLLLVQSIVIMVILSLAAFLLASKGLFRWTSVGFWSLAAFALYFVINPLTSLQSDMSNYYKSMALSEGLPRAEWIGFTAISGMIVFFIAYLVAPVPQVNWSLDRSKDEQWSIPSVLIIGAFLAIATLSLLIYRSSVVAGGNDVVIQNGRFVGSATGYEYVAHNFYFVPIAILLLSRSRKAQLLGWIFTFLYFVLGFLAAWSRHVIVSIIIVVSMITLMKNKQKWPSPVYVLVLFVIVGVLILRGHSGLESTGEFLSLVQELPSRLGSIFGTSDSSMLASWYSESYLKDTITGYDYGLPLLNYALFGFFPSRFIPFNKYFLVDWLRSVQPPVLDSMLFSALYGAKSSLLGSFYGNGGYWSVIICMILMGFACKYLDGMITENTPLLVKATGVCWIGTMWMIWGSHDYWGLTTLGVLAMPSIVLWFFLPKAKKQNPYLKQHFIKS